MSSNHHFPTIFYLHQQDRKYFIIRWETNLYNGMLSRTDVWELHFQVSLPHYTTRTFLRTAITRYAKFLSLKLKNPDQFLVPCYDIDLVWHSHQVKQLGNCSMIKFKMLVPLRLQSYNILSFDPMRDIWSLLLRLELWVLRQASLVPTILLLNHNFLLFLMQTDPVKYLTETGAILGEPLNHDDSVNDRSQGSKLSNASQVTSNLWKETFGEEFRRPGRNFE